MNRVVTEGTAPQSARGRGLASRGCQRTHTVRLGLEAPAARTRPNHAGRWQQPREPALSGQARRGGGDAADERHRLCRLADEGCYL